MKKQFKRVAVICASTLLAASFYSCEKEGANNQENEVKTVPFFEVEKGDSISKSIFREKPEFGDDEVEVLFTTENQLKGEGTSIVLNSPKYICNLKTWVSKKNDAPNTKDGYTKIPVDLNEGAGGKWIYLYYSKTNTIDQGLTSLSAKAQVLPITLEDQGWNTIGTDFDILGGWTDLNDGAGGHYIKLQTKRWSHRKELSGEIITEIAVISSASSTPTLPAYFNFGNWYRVETDLNKGAGGKYIYLYFKIVFVDKRQ